MCRVGNIDLAVAVGVCQRERLTGKQLDLCEMALDGGHVADIHPAVEIYVADTALPSVTLGITPLSRRTRCMVDSFRIS